jgi:hypothetical protein
MRISPISTKLLQNQVYTLEKGLACTESVYTELKFCYETKLIWLSQVVIDDCGSQKFFMGNMIWEGATLLIDSEFIRDIWQVGVETFPGSSGTIYPPQ